MANAEVIINPTTENPHTQEHHVRVTSIQALRFRERSRFSKGRLAILFAAVLNLGFFTYVGVTAQENINHSSDTQKPEANLNERINLVERNSTEAGYRSLLVPDILDDRTIP